ncbi:hypothetical protein PR202_gb08984 [Eleusine coracana subsp. coracana]|uniref:RRM domain-containing protein n=1 Tax=Eleusine coracana subsp. coracana TaxID=191504 RepID=A0AAV5EG13_ELECO|nr:hypothetical protein PR202_gb08984 [Eleusine coracana subsp. coracana]
MVSVHLRQRLETQAEAIVKRGAEGQRSGARKQETTKAIANCHDATPSRTAPTAAAAGTDSSRSKRVGGCPVACQFASLGRAAPSSQRKLFVTNVPERAAHDELRGFFSRFGEVDKGADPATGLFRGYAIFLYKTTGGLKKALEEPNKVFDGCELLCRRALRVSKWKHYTGVAADTGGHSNDAAVAASSPALQTKDLALASEKPMLSSNPPVGLTAAPPPLFRQNAAAGGAGILGACPSATAVSSSLPRQNASSAQPSCSGAAFDHVELSTTAKASGLHSVPATIGASNSVSSPQFQGSAALTSAGCLPWVFELHCHRPI